MKTILKITTFSVALLILVVGLGSCDKSPHEISRVTEFTWEILPATELENLKGSRWKLVGIVDVIAGNQKELTPKDCEKCYNIVFGDSTICYNDDGFYTLFLFTSINTLRGCYMVDSETQHIVVSNFGGTRAQEIGDGDLFHDAFLSVQTLSLRENELRLFYNNKQNYLLFKSIQPRWRGLAVRADAV